MSNFSRSHGLPYTRLLCPSPPPRVCPSSCPLHWWCHPAISSSGTLFTFCPQSFPASRIFPMSHLSASDDQIIGASASASVLSVNIQGWSPLRLAGLILLRKTSRSLLQHLGLKAAILWHPVFFKGHFSHLYVTSGKTIALSIWTFVHRVMSLLFNTLSRFVITFLSSYDFTAAVTICSDFGVQEEEICHYFHLSLSICQK